MHRVISDYAINLQREGKPGKGFKGFNHLLKAWAPFQMVQFHYVVTVQDESVSVLRAGETRIQLLHTPG